MSVFSVRSARAAAVAASLLLACCSLLLLSARDASAVPANDNFPGATISSVPFSQAVDTTGATTEPDEPSPNCGGLSLFGEPVAHTAWWTFTPNDAATYVVDLETGGDFSAVLGVWRESRFPAGGLASVGCAILPVFPGFPSPTETRMSFQAEAGETYYLQLGGSDIFGEGAPTQGAATLSLSQPLPPVNDDFGDAITIPGLPYETDVDITGATVEPGEPQTGCLEAPILLGTTAWYSYTAPESQDVLVDLIESTGFPVAAVWSGQPGALTEEACGILFSFHAQPGETYYIQLGEWYSDEYPLVGGVAHLHMQELLIPDCPALNKSVSDPIGDAAPPLGEGFPFGPSLADVKQIRYGTNADVACFQFEFQSLPPADSQDAFFTSVLISFDVDSNANTGFPLVPGDEFNICNQQGPLGIEADVYASIDSSITPVYGGFFGIAGYAFVSRAGNNLLVAVPIDAIGGDQAFDFVAASDDANFNFDCVPNVGIVRVTGPVVPSFGDLNCNGTIGPDDSVAVLSTVAGTGPDIADGCPQIGEALPWAYPSGAGNPTFTAGDVDCDTQITPLDALAILRAAANLPVDVEANCPTIGTPPL